LNLQVLRDEIQGDPLGRGYSGMNAAEILADLTTAYRDRNRISMSGSEILNAVDSTDWNGLDATNKQAVWDLVHLGTLNPFGVESTMLTNVFGGGSTTIAALNAARKETVSRAVELDIGSVSLGNVEQAVI
jgi:hypothetical protein